MVEEGKDDQVRKIRDIKKERKKERKKKKRMKWRSC